MSEEKLARGLNGEVVIEKDGEYIGCDSVENVELQSRRRIARMEPQKKLFFLFRKKDKISFVNDVLPILMREYGDEPLRGRNHMQKDIEDLLVKSWTDFQEKWIAVPKFEPGDRNMTVIDIVYKKNMMYVRATKVEGAELW